MKRRGRLWSIVLAVALAVIVSGSTPNCALAGGDTPAYKLPGMDWVWSFIDWLFPSGGSGDGGSGSGDDGGGEEDEGEKMFDEYYGPW